MCRDIEENIRLQIIRDVFNDQLSDGYDTVHEFLSLNPNVLVDLNKLLNSFQNVTLIYCCFSIGKSVDGRNVILSYNDCPIWVLVELLSFGYLQKLYEFYYSKRNKKHISKEILNLVRNSRNAVAHNTCILNDLNIYLCYPPVEIKNYVSKKTKIPIYKIKKRLTSRPVLELVTLIYVYNKIVPNERNNIIKKEINELNSEVIKYKSYFDNNELLLSTYKFIIEFLNVTFLDL